MEEMMGKKISRADAQAEIDGLLVAEIVRDFGVNFHDVYPIDVLALGVGPMQSMIGLAIKRGHLMLPERNKSETRISEQASEQRRAWPFDFRQPIEK
jgi:hypothetical protein